MTSQENNYGYDEQSLAYYEAWRQYYESIGYQSYYPYYNQYPNANMPGQFGTVASQTQTNEFAPQETSTSAIYSNHNEASSTRYQKPSTSYGYGYGQNPIIMKDLHTKGIDKDVHAPQKPINNNKIIKKDEAKWDKIQWVKDTSSNSTQEHFESNTVLITGVPSNATEEFLFKTFSTLGPIASQISNGKPKIRIIRGVNTDACVIRYVEDSVAEAVIKEFNGVLTGFVRENEDSSNNVDNRSNKHGYETKTKHLYKQRGRAGFGLEIKKNQDTNRSQDNSNNQPSLRSWDCAKCGNVNFPYRTECEECHTKKPNV